MNNLEQKERERIRLIHYGYYFNENKKVYFKPCRNYLEKVVERLAHLVGINCAHYETVEIEGNSFYLSEEIGSNFLTMENYNKGNMPHQNINRLNDYFNEEFPIVANNLIYELVKMYLFDIFIINPDRCPSNWGFTFNHDVPEKLYILDNESSFNIRGPVLLSAGVMKRQSNLNDYEKSSLQTNLEDLKFFLDTFHEDFIQLFVDMYKALNIESVKKVFKTVEQEENISLSSYFSLYINNYQAIGELLRRRGLK